MESSQITVSEQDFRKHRANLAHLRRCQLPPPLPQADTEMEQKSEFEMSFKSAFRIRCQSPADYRDPWKGIDNPEGKRAPNEMDLVINQYLPPSSPKVTLPAMPMSGNVTKSHIPSPSPRARQRSRQQRDTSLPSTRSGCGSSNASTGSTHCPTSRDSSVSSRTTVKSRIQLCNDNDDPCDASASMSSQTDTRLPQFQKRHMSPQLAVPDGDGNYAAWLSVDPRKGNVDVYPREAALRLEAGFQNDARNVNFVGLAGVLQDKMVDLRGAKDGGRMMQVSLKGRREVRRVQVDAQSGGLYVAVIHDGTWKFASDASSAQSESRWTELSNQDIVCDQAIAQTPQAKRDHQFFVNVGAFGCANE